MTAVQLLNQHFNRSLRILNDLAVAISKSDRDDRVAALQKIAQVVDEISTLQSAIHKDDPGLEFHYDPSRPSSTFMIEVSRLISEAVQLEGSKQFDAAIEKLDIARSLEPPALTYEMLTKRISELRDSKLK